MVQKFDRMKALYRLLDKSLFNPVQPMLIRAHKNITKDKNVQVNINKVYSVLWATYPGATREYIITTKDCKLKEGLCSDVCFKKISEKKAAKMPGSAAWMTGGVGACYYQTTPKVNIKLFLEKLKIETQWTWHNIIDYLSDGTGQIDTRVKEVMKTMTIELPFSDYKLWQALNCHIIMITNSGVGKTTSFSRLCNTKSMTDYSVPGIFGTLNLKTYEPINGSLYGTGGAAFDEFPEIQDNDHQTIVTDLLNYLANGENSRSLAGRNVDCLGCKAVAFFGNVPEHWDIQSFHKMITKLAGNESLDRVGRRFGIILYGEDYNKITSSEANPIIKKIQFILEEMMNEKKYIIQKILYQMKPWIETIDKEYEEFFDKIQVYVMENKIKMFLKGFKGSWNRLKMAALKRAILEHLPLLYSKYSEAYKVILDATYNYYDLFKKYNYGSFEFLFQNIKHNVIHLIKEGKTYEEIVLTGINVPLCSYNQWKWEYERSLKQTVLQ